ncbi:hypothetical protein GQ53DRAFT_126206 [Thozetella sp. PMI_491]|nr:hypothetical protein GQ53DRAFT_126206 [Thozetella sp. PMI_491]
MAPLIFWFLVACGLGLLSTFLQGSDRHLQPYMYLPHHHTGIAPQDKEIVSVDGFGTPVPASRSKVELPNELHKHQLDLTDGKIATWADLVAIAEGHVVTVGLASHELCQPLQNGRFLLHDP